ncbi:hypothetical protein Q7P36_000853 [Cladosporium allicinum]
MSTTLARLSLPPVSKRVPANIARKRHVSTNEKPTPNDNNNPSSIQHRRRKLLAFQIDITDLIPNTFMVNFSLGHYLGKLAAAKQAFDDVWEMAKNRSHPAITAYCLFGRPLLTNRQGTKTPHSHPLSSTTADLVGKRQSIQRRT